MYLLYNKRGRVYWSRSNWWLWESLNKSKPQKNLLDQNILPTSPQMIFCTATFCFVLFSFVSSRQPPERIYPIHTICNRLIISTFVN